MATLVADLQAGGTFFRALVAGLLAGAFRKKLQGHSKIADRLQFLTGRRPLFAKYTLFVA
jgi:hypothetical protein